MCSQPITGGASLQHPREGRRSEETAAKPPRAAVGLTGYSHWNMPCTGGGREPGRKAAGGGLRHREEAREEDGGEEIKAVTLSLPAALSPIYSRPVLLVLRFIHNYAYAVSRMLVKHQKV